MYLKFKDSNKRTLVCKIKSIFTEPCLINFTIQYPTRNNSANAVNDTVTVRFIKIEESDGNIVDELYLPPYWGIRTDKVTLKDAKIILNKGYTYEIENFDDTKREIESW